MNIIEVNKRLGTTLGPLYPIVVFFMLALGALSLCRFLLVLWQWDRVSAVEGVWPVIGLGLRMDTVLLCMLLVFPTVLVLVTPNRWQRSRIWHRASALILTLLAVFLVFMEAATPAFIDQYDSRQNRVFVEYLIYSKELFATLWFAYKPELIISTVLVGLTAFYSWRINTRINTRISACQNNWPWQKRLIILPLAIIIMFVGVRSSFDHRPANISTAAFSSDHLVNALALSSTYNVLYAVYGMRYEADASRFYPNLPNDEIIQQIRTSMNVSNTAFSDPAIPSLHRQKPTTTPVRPINLVIILEESMGAAFVESLGGLALTSELEKLSNDGIWFSNLYATGTRSVRGLEAVISGILPSPARSVVKLGLAQQGFYTLAQTLKLNGYSTEFIYGGESHFDNMASFFLSNGFDRTLDKHDFKNPSFLGSWGVSDEDLFNEAHETFLQHGDKPFFSLVFTTSFHSPFEFPDGSIDLYEQPKNTQNNAVKYADYALGKYIKKAKKSAYWDNTVFLVVADHNTRVYGASLVPIPYFKIPGLILGGSIKSECYNFVASQIDLGPTLLSLIGVECSTPMVGRDLTTVASGYQGRAVMQYGNNHAYMEGNNVIIHQPYKQSEQYVYDNAVLTPVNNIDPALDKMALAYALWPSMVYKEQRYRLPVTMLAPHKLAMVAPSAVPSP